MFWYLNLSRKIYQRFGVLSVDGNEKMPPDPQPNVMQLSQDMTKLLNDRAFAKATIRDRVLNELRKAVDDNHLLLNES